MAVRFKTTGSAWMMPGGGTASVYQLTSRDVRGVQAIAFRAFPQDYPRDRVCSLSWLRRFLNGLPNFFPVGVSFDGMLVAYLIWENLGGPGSDIAEYLQMATHPDWQGQGFGKLITVVGRMLLDQYRDCCGMPPVRKVKVSTADTNRAQSLYREWLLPPTDTQSHRVRNMYFGNTEVFLTGSVRSYSRLLLKLKQAGFCPALD